MLFCKKRKFKNISLDFKCPSILGPQLQRKNKPPGYLSTKGGPSSSSEVTQALLHRSEGSFQKFLRASNIFWCLKMKVKNTKTGQFPLGAYTALSQPRYL